MVLSITAGMPYRAVGFETFCVEWGPSKESAMTTVIYAPDLTPVCSLKYAV